MAKLADHNLLNIGGFPGTFTLSQEAVEVTGGHEPDPNWSYTDKKGHAHYYWNVSAGRSPYISLREVTESYFCPDCHEDHSTSHYECIACGEKITPGTKTPDRKFIGGAVSGHANVTIPPGIQPPDFIEFEHHGKAYEAELVSWNFESGLPGHAEYAVINIGEGDEMVRIEDTDDEKVDGLYTKYRVFREPDDSETHPAQVRAEYLGPQPEQDIISAWHLLEEVPGFIFPLKPDTDRHARVALAAYAWSVMEEKPDLAKDLLDTLDDLS